MKNTKVFHAGTRFNGNTIETSGGRVLGVTAWADTLQEAQTMSYNAVNKIHFEGAFYRKDIASKALK